MTKRDRIVLSVVASAAVLAACWFVLLAPRREEAAKAAERVTAAQSRIDAAQAKLTAATAAKRDYNKQVLTIARLGKAVPPTDDVPSLMYQLERTARDAGVDFRSFKVEQSSGAAAAPSASASAGITPMPLKVTFKGEFSELRRFLDSVQGFARTTGDTLDVKGRLLTVDGIAMAPGGNVWPKVTANLVVSAYTAPAADALKTGTAGAAGAATTTPPASGSPATPAASSSPTTPPPAFVGGLLP